MRTLRILQISDLLAGSPRISAGDILNELTLWVDETAQPGTTLKPVDYIAVCGNIVDYKLSYNFEKAAELLRELGQALLVKDPAPNGLPGVVTKFHRMIIVPGQFDLFDHATRVQQPDFQPFKEFYDAFFEKERAEGTVSAFQQGEPICQQLRDVTLVGACYWEAGAARLKKSLLGGLERELARARVILGERGRFENEYFSYRPLLLVTASYPQYSWGVRDAYMRLRNFLGGELKVSLHLFGSGPYVGILPEPYSLPHVGLGTGPRSFEKFWPFRANLVEMCLWGANDQRLDATPRISNYVFHRLPKVPNFTRSDYISGHLDRFFPPPAEPPQEGAAYGSFFDKIGKAIFDDKKRFIFITGLPGVGKDDFLRAMQKQKTLRGREVLIVGIELGEYSQLAQRLEDARSEIKRSGWPRKDLNIILAVRDRRYQRVLSPSKDDVEQFLDKAIDDFFLTDLVDKDGLPAVKAVLYIVSNADMSVPPRWESLTERDLVLEPLQPGDASLLVKQYARHAPVIEFEVNTITGRLAGFGRLLLDAVRDEFQKSFHSSDPIGSGVSARLIEDALRWSDKLKRKSDVYLTTIESMHAGAAVSKQIQHEIRKRLNEQGEFDEPLKTLRIVISAEDIKRRLTTRQEREEVYSTLDKLVRMGVLAREAGGEDLYRLLPVVPFRSGMRRRLLPPTPITHPGGINPVQETTIDFLIITALKEEREAVLRLLPDARKVDPSKDDTYTYYAATVPAKTGQGTEGVYNVIVVSYSGMGRAGAGVVTATVLQRWRPRYTVLVGIAGGFEQRGVRKGDILIADKIIDYELQKLHEHKDEVRTEVFKTSQRLRHFSDNFTEVEYKDQMPPGRPDGGVPKVIPGDIASGDKVDARGEIFKKFAEAWPKMVGVEMEAAGAALAVHHL